VNGTSTENSRDRHLFEPGPKCILTFDGGGARSVIATIFLKQVETAIGNQLKRKVRLCDYFDLVGGTSTGAILACAVALGYSAPEIEQIFRPIASSVFKRSVWRLLRLQPKFDTRAMRNEIQRLVGNRTLGSNDLSTGLCIVAKRVDTGSPWIVTNNPHALYWDSKPGQHGYVGNRGAVLLVSPAALASDWVCNEATILGHRYDRAIAYEFPFLIIYVGGTTQEQIDKPKFGLMQLNRINSIMFGPTRIITDADLMLFKPLHQAADTEEAELFFDISDELRKAEELRLMRIGERLDPDLTKWAPQTRRKHPAECLATLLVAMSLKDAATQLRRIWRTEEREPKYIINLLEPSWSDPRSVEWLADDFVNQAPPRTAIVRVTDVASLRCHIERARRRDHSKEWYEVEVGKLGDREPDDTIAALSAELADRMDADITKVREGILAWLKRGNPCLFLFRSKNDYDAVGQAVQDKFGPVHCLVLDRSEPLAAPNEGPVSIMPHIDPGREKDYLVDRSLAFMVINSKGRG